MRLTVGLIIPLLFWSPAFLVETHPLPERAIVLTFDNGPRPHVLKELLPLLEKYGVSTTFFVIGKDAHHNASFIRKMHNAGHEIESHSLAHDNFKKLFAKEGAAGIQKNLKETADIILKITGRRPIFFRPPDWELTEEIEKIITAAGYRVMKLGHPDVNTLDYDDVSKGHSASVLVERVKKRVAQEEARGNYQPVLVFHEQLLTVEALKVLIPYFQERGYVFLRLDEVIQK